MANNQIIQIIPEETKLIVDEILVKDKNKTFLTITEFLKANRIPYKNLIRRNKNPNIFIIQHPKEYTKAKRTLLYYKECFERPYIILVEFWDKSLYINFEPRKYKYGHPFENEMKFDSEDTKLLCTKLDFMNENSIFNYERIYDNSIKYYKLLSETMFHIYWYFDLYKIPINLRHKNNLIEIKFLNLDDIRNSKSCGYVSPNDKIILNFKKQKIKSLHINLKKERLEKYIKFTNSTKNRNKHPEIIELMKGRFLTETSIQPKIQSSISDGCMDCILAGLLNDGNKMKFEHLLNHIEKYRLTGDFMGEIIEYFKDRIRHSNHMLFEVIYKKRIEERNKLEEWRTHSKYGHLHSKSEISLAYSHIDNILPNLITNIIRAETNLSSKPFIFTFICRKSIEEYFFKEDLEKIKPYTFNPLSFYE